MTVTLAPARKYLLIVLAGIALILAAETLGLFVGMDNHCYDLFFRLRGPAEPDNRILIAAVDEHTLNRLGRWPLRRLHYARLLDRLGQARFVGMDILMVEPAEDDAVLARAIGKHGRVALPAYIVKSLRVAEPVAVLSPCRVGHVHLEQDIDGVVRRVYHTLATGNQTLPSFASAIHEGLSGTAFPREGPAGHGRDQATQARIIQRDARRINYYGPPGTFPRLSLADIVDGRYPADFFKDRIVLVGVTAVGLEAGVLTPFTQHRDQMHGVETHAHILGNLLDRVGIVEVAGPLRWAVSLGIALLFFAFFLRLGGWQAALLWLTGAAGASAAAFVLFALFHGWFSPVLFAFLLTFLFCVAYMYRLEQTGRQLGEAKEEWERSFNTIDDAIVLTDAAGTAVRMNSAAGRLLEPRLLDLLARKYPLPRQGAAEPASNGQGGDRAAAGEDRVEEMYDPPSERHLEIKSIPRLDTTGRPSGHVHVVRDITERKKVEEEKERLQFQLLQSQKMQSIGRLASGVAHDFNNILTAILGYSEIALMRLPEKNPLRNSIQIIHDSGLKATALTRQLLAFSRKQVMELQVVNLGDVVEGMVKILARVIGEDVTVKVRVEKPLGNVLADPAHLEQILMNLAVNARDAMPQGGTMTIETADVELDEAYAAAHAGVSPGLYVMLAVTDTGGGMSPEVQARIFEPFFTTKKVGEGTGLGLATVSGIVNQMSGHIYVYSELGKGSVFKVYLPVCREDAAAKAAPEAFALPRGTETVLIAEDDRSIRTLVPDLLEPLGYRVIAARSGAEAVQLAQAAGRRIDILLTDVVMPGMGGKELARMLQTIYPGIKVLFMSGYSEDVITRHGVEQEGVAFIQKPLIPHKLVLKLREVLDGK
ncbi:MAG: CHASE2 domain-containing protein [Syntrophales bacterium]